jgi:hypothetical protein
MPVANAMKRLVHGPYLVSNVLPYDHTVPCKRMRRDFGETAMTDVRNSYRYTCKPYVRKNP